MPARRLVILCCVLCMSPLGELGAAEPRPADTAIEQHLADESSYLSQNELDGALSRPEWETRREKLRRQYLDMLGLWPLPDRTPLQAAVTGSRQRPQFRVENVHFQSRPGLYVTGNLYLPRPLPSEKLPAVLYVCGHSGRGRDGNKTAFQHHGMWFATHGYACLVIDTLQLGEVAGIHHGTYNRERWWWQAAGYTPAGVECWNGVRAIDYLTSRPEVDAARIAVTGISGGGAATLWIAAADERVKVCVPVSGMSDLQSYVDDKVVNGHCDCMFLYNTYRWEWTTIAALVAPRPMLFENSGHDSIFPMPANERIRTRLEKLYGWYQTKPGELFDIGVTPGGHNDNVELRLMAYRWINRHLRGDNAEVSEPPLPPFAGQELRVFPEDRDLPADSINGRVDESFVGRGTVIPPADRGEFAAWSKRLRDGLAERVFRDWPEPAAARDLGSLALRPNPFGPAGTEGQPGTAGASDPRVLATDEHIRVLASRHGTQADRARTEPESSGERKRAWLIVLNPDEKAGGMPEWARGLVGLDESAVVLSPRGSGEALAWTRKNPPNYVERAHALLGRTVDTGRVWDVQATARWIHEGEGGGELSLAVAGRGPAGILGAYAALWEGCIEEVAVVDPPVSHRDGPILLNVLRVLDIPDAIGLLAPRRVTLVTADPSAFDRSRGAFQAAGTPERLVVRQPAAR